MRRHFEDMDDDELEQLKDQIEAMQEERRRANPYLRLEEWEKTTNQVRLRIEDMKGVKTYCYQSGLRMQVTDSDQIRIGVANPQPKTGDYIHWDTFPVWSGNIAEGIVKFKERLTSLLSRAEWEVTEYKNALAKLA